MEFRLLGPLEVVDGNDPVALGGAKQRAVLAHLLLQANRVVPPERLIDEVWEDDPPAAVRNVLQTYVSRLRKAVGEERLEHRSGGYVLSVASGELDADRFRSLVVEARRRAALDPEAAVGFYREADALWRGPALSDLAEQRSLRGEIAELEALRAAAAEERIVAELSLARHAELVPELEHLSAVHPLRESTWAHLITALYRSGRQADALAAYRRARSVLVEELGLEPSAELRRLEQQVLHQDPALDVTGRPLRGYRLLEKVGEGAFGIVHRAVQPQVGREVAVRVVRPSLADDPEFIRRFEAEAQLVARLEHPHIVPLYDYWREPGGAFLVMRFLRGRTLRDLLADALPAPDAALLIAEQVAGALASAHRQGVVHGDVRPGNILFDEEGNAYLTDFSIARGLAAAPAVDRGSVDRGSPEELRGESPTVRTDVHDLGRVLEKMLAHVLRPPVEAVLRRATAVDPADRYADAVELAAALAGATRGAPRERTPDGPIRNPYKGLRPFFEPDAPDFHGRERLVSRLLDRVRAERLVALVGPSGSGKSSVVRAGLVPAVRAGSPRWFVAEMTPGSDAFAELASSLTGLAAHAPWPDLAGRLRAVPGALPEVVARLLPDETSELLLVVDQLEELFTRVPEEEHRAAFLTALGAASTSEGSRVRLVLTLRADFLDRPLAQPGFAELLQEAVEWVLPMGAEEIERAISGPARRVGVRVEPGLVAALVSEATGQPGALPLLQFALAELFDRRQDGELTLAAYQALGGVGGGIARGAEEAYESLPGPGRETARQLFLRLVDDANGRRPALRGELASLGRAMDRVIDVFAARRLLSFDRDPGSREPTVEIAHDALVEAWDRLRAWLSEAREDLESQRRLSVAARDWSESGRDPSFLLRGARLERLERPALEPTALERAFLEASLAERHRQREYDRRSLRRLRALTVVLGAAATMAGTLTIFAFDQRSKAERERRGAFARELASAAVANLDVDAERSVLLALEAVDRTRAADGTVLPAAEEALHRAVVASRIRLRVPNLGGALDWSPEGLRFATEGPEESGIIDVRDAATGKSLRSFRGHEVDVNLVAFSADGAMLATSGDDGSVSVWDPRTGERLQDFESAEGQVWGVSFSPDGSLLAASFWAEETVRIWEVETGRQVSEIRQPALSLTTSFSPDGRRLAIPAFERGAVVVDVRSGRELLRLDRQGPINDVDFSPDGRWIATSGSDSTVVLWDARTGLLRTRLFGHKGEVVAADWTADSRRLATGSDDGTARVWDVRPDGAREVLTIPAQERGGGLWVAFSPDGSRLMTGDEEMTAVKVWDVGLTGGAEWENLPAPIGVPNRVAFTGANAVATARRDGSLQVWDAETGARRARIPAAGSPGGGPVALDADRDGTVATAAGTTVRSWDPTKRREAFRRDLPGGADDLAWSPDGAFLAAASADGARILDRSGRVTGVLDALPGYRISAVGYSPSGRRFATARISTVRPAPGAGEVSLWDWPTRRFERTIRTVAEELAFSPDGARLATASPFGPVEIWDVATGRRTGRLTGHTGAVNAVAFAPRGTTAATASNDGTVRLWNASTGVQTLVLRGHEGPVSDLAFSRDATKLATTSPDGTTRVWAIMLDDLVELARDRLTRPLSPEECRQYLRGRGRAC